MSVLRATIGEQAQAIPITPISQHQAPAFQRPLIQREHIMQQR